MSSVIAIDIGNTQTKIALIDIDKGVTLKKSILCPYHNSELFTEQLRNFLQSYNSNIQIRISCVQKSKRDELIPLLNSVITHDRYLFIESHEKLPFINYYKFPERLGADRVANCLYAITYYPNTDCIIVDSGTATNIEVITADKEFLGGYICSGIKLQLNSLFNETADLPKISQFNSFTPTIPQETEKAIIDGTFFSTIGGIQALIDNIQNEQQKRFTVLACGGAWEYITPYVQDRFSFTFVPDLTLIGTALYTK